MIVFDQLNITPDGKHLVIEARVDTLDYFKDVEIDSIVIDSQDTYVDNGPSQNPVYIKEFTVEDDLSVSIPCCDCDACEEGRRLTRHIKILLSDRDLNVSLNNTILFVYVIAKGYPSPDTPCGYDNSKTMGVVVNLYPYYQSMMNGIKEIADDCSVPKQFINNVLRFKAVELAIKTGNYIQAIKYWKMFFSPDKLKATTKPCGCYGRSN